MDFSLPIPSSAKARMHLYAGIGSGQKIKAGLRENHA
jgi:hypothetical protein